MIMSAISISAHIGSQRLRVPKDQCASTSEESGDTTVSVTVLLKVQYAVCSGLVPRFLRQMK